jgi:hypothetical protein
MRSLLLTPSDEITTAWSYTSTLPYVYMALHFIKTNEFTFYVTDRDISNLNITKFVSEFKFQI